MNNKREKADMAVLYQQIMQVMSDKEPFTDEKFGASTLAKTIGSNRTYVFRAVRECTGKTFREWLAEIRNQRILEILNRNPEATVAELCVKVGLSNRNTFSRQFRLLNGKNLTEYRAKIVQENNTDLKR